MEIIKIKLTHTKAEEFEALCNRVWNGDFRKDFSDDEITIQDTEIYILMDKERVVGGAVINDKILISPYTSPEKLLRRAKLQSQGYKGCSYVVIDPEYRGQGLASKILKHLQSQERKIWLRVADPSIQELYTKNGFQIDMPSTEEEVFLLLTYTA